MTRSSDAELMEKSLVDTDRFGEILDGKGATSTTATSNIFQLLSGHGVPTHFLGGGAIHDWD